MNRKAPQQCYLTSLFTILIIVYYFDLCITQASRLFNLLGMFWAEDNFILMNWYESVVLNGIWSSET